MRCLRPDVTNLTVSRIALGGMGFGHVTERNPWSLDEHAAAPILRRAVELGITLWNTANVYGGGNSEVISGRAVRRYSRRGDVVLATRVGLPMHAGTDGMGLSGEAIRKQIDASLKRLGTDYIDVHQIHRFDPLTPVEETMEPLQDIVEAGEARVLGASPVAAWQFGKLQHAADRGGWTRFVSIQDQYSLVQREEEREMFGLVADQGVVSLPRCPLAKGRLARPYVCQTERSKQDPLGREFFDRPIVDAVEQLARVRGVSMAQVALACVLAQPSVTAPITGATKPAHLDEAAAAVELALTDAEHTAPAATYTPREPTGY